MEGRARAALMRCAQAYVCYLQREGMAHETDETAKQYSDSNSFLYSHSLHERACAFDAASHVTTAPALLCTLHSRG